MVQLFSVCHYLLERCCFTVIKPSKDDWAFDLFQSLNATGTPLTAIETFLPLVVNTTQQNERYRTSKTKQDFENIENLFLNTRTAAQKNKLTNDFLTSLALSTKGRKLSSHFSDQRKWLNKVYIEQGDYNNKKALINFYGNYATYYKNVWLDYSGSNNLAIEQIKNHSEADLTSLLILFLKSSNHKMSITILGRYYHEILLSQKDSISNFVKVTKLIASFYILWRTVRTNSGLDKVYRDFLHEVDGYNWVRNKNIPLNSLREHFRNALSKIGVKDKKSWKLKALSHLRYNNSKKNCKIILLIAFDQTIPDDNFPGLMKLGTPGVAPYLNLQKWNSDDLKTIEHVAPQNESGWDIELYSNETKLYQAIGNLTLLPLKVNSSVGKKGWAEKLLYYEHISEKDPNKIKELQIQAKKDRVELNPNTIEILKNVNYNQHMEALVAKGNELEWNKAFVEKRSERILDLAWDVLEEWIGY